MNLREEQIKAVDELIKSADYVTNGHLLNREQIVMLCNREIEKRIDSLKNKQLVPILEYTLSTQEDKASMSYYHRALEDVKELLK